MFNEPRFHPYVIAIYAGIMADPHAPMPTKCELASRLIRENAVGFADAVLALDKTKSHKDILPRALREQSSGRAA